MKSILLLSLLFVCVLSSEELPSLESSNDIIDIVKCFLGKEELITDVKDIIETIKSGDYSKLITIALKVYTDVTNAVKDCLPQEDTQLTFGYNNIEMSYYTCRMKCGCKNTNLYCLEKCRRRYENSKALEKEKRKKEEALRRKCFDKCGNNQCYVDCLNNNKKKTTKI